MRHTKAQVLDQFRYNWKVAVMSDKSLKYDKIAKREAWNNFVDMLNKEGDVLTIKHTTGAILSNG